MKLFLVLTGIVAASAIDAVEQPTSVETAGTNTSAASLAVPIQTTCPKWCNASCCGFTEPSKECSVCE
jgi:hypothetical protein